MTDRFPVIESELAEVASSIDWPDGPVVGVALRRIEEGSERSPERRGAVWKAAVAALLAVVFTLAFPAGRQAVARLLGVAGIEVAFGFDGSAEWGEMGLGEVVSAERAAELAGRSIALPVSPGAPDEIRVVEGELVVVHAIWGPRDGLPAVPGTDTGLLLTQFVSETDDAVFHKSLSEATTISVVSVGEADGLWVEGAPHEVTYPTPEGEVTDVISRLAANVLMWEDGGVTFRLETSLGLDAAVRIAETMEAVEWEG